MFGFILRTLLAFLATVAVGRYILGEFNAVVWISSGIAVYTVNQMTMANMMPVGHGVNGSRHIIGMPMFVFVSYLALLGLILFTTMVNEPTLLPVTNANFRVLGLGFFFGWAGGIIDWYVSSSKMTWYFSEYRERMVMKAKGLDEQRINTLIDQMRRARLLPPKAKSE